MHIKNKRSPAFQCFFGIGICPCQTRTDRDLRFEVDVRQVEHVVLHALVAEGVADDRELPEDVRDVLLQPEHRREHRGLVGHEGGDEIDEVLDHRDTQQAHVRGAECVEVHWRAARLERVYSHHQLHAQLQHRLLAAVGIHGQAAREHDVHDVGQHVRLVRRVQGEVHPVCLFVGEYPEMCWGAI